MQSDGSPVTVPAAVADRPRLLDRALRIGQMRSFWALADQGIASISNFVTVILVGRMLSVEAMGAFSLLWETMMYLNSLHAALVVYPLSVRGAKVDVDRLRQFTTIGIIFTIVLVVPFSGTMFVLGAWQHILIGCFAAAAILAFQVHETMRRSLMSHFMYQRLIIGDAVGYLGSAGSILILAQLGILSVAAVFASMTIAFALASFVQWLNTRPTRAKPQQLREAAGEFWALGGWMLASNLTTIFTGIGVQYALAFAQDLTHVGKFQAIANMLRLTNPLVQAMAGLIVPAVARSGERREALKYAILGFCILAPYFGILFIVPRFGVALFYGADSEYVNYPAQVRIAVATAAAGYCTAMLLSTLSGLGNSKGNFYAQIANTLTSVLLVLPVAIFLGWEAALLAGFSAMLITGFTALVLLLRTPSHRPVLEPTHAPPPTAK